VKGAERARPGGNRHLLGAGLRRLREERSLRLEDVAGKLDVAPSTLSRIENGMAPARTSYVTVLLDVYEVSDPAERRRLTDLAREGQRKGWWDACADLLSAETGQYLDLEATARELLSYSGHVVPGLLQLPEYAEAAFLAARPGLTADEARALTVVQIQRRELVRRNRRLRLHLIFDESALVRPVGGARVLTGQLRRLAEHAASLNATVQVVGLGCAGQPVSPAFTILGLAEPQPSEVACVGGLGGQVAFAKRRADVRVARDVFDALARAAMSPADSLSLIEKTAAQGSRQCSDGN
jgi:transcriptional regulator with XRE-family HTH domain